MRFHYSTLLLLILLPILIFFFTRGVASHDEGYILQSSYKLLHGLLPYRDFHFANTPLSLFLTALSLSILPSILASRILMLIIALISCWLIFRIVILSTKNKLYATLSVLLFIAWSPSHINFSWPVNFAIPAALISCYLLMKFLDTRNKKYLFIAGFFSFLVFLAKQNFGVAILFPVLIFFLIKSSRKISNALFYVYGYMWGIILFSIYLLWSNSFSSFVNDMHLLTYKWIFEKENLNTQFIYHDSALIMIARTGLYLAPLIVSIFSFTLLFIRRRFHLLFLPVFVGSFYLLGIRPTTDFAHLTPLFSLIGIPLSLYLRYNISSTQRASVLFLICLLIILGFHTALYGGYYRSDEPIVSHNNFSMNPRILIFLNDKHSVEFVELKNIIDKHTNANDYILVNSFNPLIYFITDRKEPIRYNFLAASLNRKLYYDEVLGNLVAKKVKIVLLEAGSINSIPINKYVFSHYKFLKRVGNKDVYLLSE